MSSRANQILLGAALLALAEIVTVSVYYEITSNRVEACERAEIESFVFDSCVKTGGVCAFTAVDLQRSVDNLKYLDEQCE